MIQVHLVFQEIEVLQDHQASDHRALPERKASRVSQEGLAHQAHLVRKVNQVWLWQKKANQGPEDRMANLDFQALMVIQVSLGSLVFQVYQEPRGTLDSQALDCQDPPELKDSQVSPGNQELLVDQADRELMDVPASQEYLDLRVSLDLAYQDLQVYPVCQELKA